MPPELDTAYVSSPNLLRRHELVVKSKGGGAG